MDYKDYKRRVIKSSFKAVDELIKVIEEEIIIDFNVDEDDIQKAMEQSALSADKLKQAAAAKKASVFDAFDILSRVEQEEKMLESADEPDKVDKKPVKKQGWAERNAN